MTEENNLLINKHILLCLDIDTKLDEYLNAELEHIKQNFCGYVFNNITDFNEHIYDQNVIIYLCGDIKKYYTSVKILDYLICVIKDFSYNYDDDCKLIDIGCVPINIKNIGVYFRNFFDHDTNYFNLISNEHKFQSLTESNKQSNAFRTGIYLTKVKQNDQDLKFNLLRCSSNLAGATDNLRDTDNYIINKVNNTCKYFFETKVELNHVLAQIYENKIIDGDEKKAKISQHSDKTKDMPKNGLIAFCTFYKDITNIKKLKTDYFDYFYKETSVLTKIRFRLKKMVDNPKLEKIVDISLYPNSVFIISLMMNRLYTHEIIPSGLPIDKLPIRLGYVIRCSNKNAIFRNEQTYIVDKDNIIKLEKPDEVGVVKLKEFYYKENTTDELITYDNFYFSLNSGDYKQPNM